MITDGGAITRELPMPIRLLPFPIVALF